MSLRTAASFHFHQRMLNFLHTSNNRMTVK